MIRNENDPARNGPFTGRNPHGHNEHRPAWKTLWPLPLFIWCGALLFWPFASAFRKFRRFFSQPFASPLLGSSLLAGCSPGRASPTARQWLSASVIAFLIFVCDYGLLFWAEKRVPSGVAAVLLATIPVFLAIAETIFLRTQRLTVRLVLALLIGLGGVAVLMSRSLNLGGAPIDKRGAVALIVASISWSLGSVFTRKVQLPPSKGMSSGAQMLAGGILLAFTAGALGEFRGFHPSEVSRGAWLALLYLIVFGSIVAYTAYVWLIHHESPTKVGTYAYVNPLVAVVVGYFLGGEALGLRTILGTVCVLTSVVVITSARAQKPAACVTIAETANAVEFVKRYHRLSPARDLKLRRSKSTG